MKFLHIADLHIGKVLHGVSLLEEQKEIFQQILRYVENEKPEAVIIAGDIYDKAVPQAAAVELFDQLLTELVSCKASVMVVAGNHDSPERLAYAARLLASRDVHLCGAYAGQIPQVVKQDAFGEVVFHLLPFVRPAMVRSFFPALSIDSHQDAVAAILQKDGWSEQPGAVKKGRHVLVAHQYVKGLGEEPERSASEVIQVGGLDGVDAGLFAAFDYVALGHLHGPQSVGAAKNRYAGSPLKYSFSEYLQKKAVTMVEMGETGEVVITSLPLSPFRDLRKLRGPLTGLLQQGVQEPGREDYLHVTLTDEEEIIDPIGKLRQVFPNVLQLEIDNTRTRAEGNFTLTEIREEKSLLDLFRLFYQEQNGSPLSPEEELFVQVIDRGGDA